MWAYGPIKIMVEHSHTIKAIRLAIYVLLGLMPIAITTATATATEAKTTLFNLVVLVMGVLWVLRLQAEDTVGLRRTPISFPIVAFLIWNIVDAIIACYRYATVPQAFRVLSYVAAYFAVTHYLSRREHLNRALSVLVAASLIPCIYGMLQHFRVDPIAWVPSSHERILATFGNPTYFAAYLAFTIPVTLAAYLLEGRRAMRWGYLAIVSLQFACLLWTYSRGPWLGTVLALAIGLGIPALFHVRQLARRYGARIGAAVFVLLLISIVLARHSGIVERAASSTDFKDPANVQRTLQWNAGYRVFTEHLIVGVGPGALKIYIPEKLTPAFFKTGIETVSEHAHNEFIEIAADTGLIGLGLFLWILVQATVMTVRCVRHAARQDPWREFHASMLLGAIGGLLVCNLVGVTMRYSCGAVYFWVYLGLLGAVCAASRAAVPGDEFLWLRVPRPNVSRVKFVRLVVVGAGIATWLAVRPFVAAMEEKKANLHLSDGHVVAAETAIQSCLQLAPHNLPVLYRLASVYRATGRNEQALEVYTYLRSLSPDYARVHYNLGALYTSLGDLQKAVEHLERAAALDGLPDSWRRLSETYRALGDGKKSAWALAKSLESDPFQGWRKQLELAHLLIKLDRPAQADTLLRRILQDNPDLVRAQLALALACEKLGKPMQAAGYYRKVLRREPDNVKARTNLGCIYYELGELEEARFQFEEAEKQGGGIELNANLGLVYWRLGENKHALEMCEAVLRTDPDCPAADQARAIIYRMTGEKRL